MTVAGILFLIAGAALVALMDTVHGGGSFFSDDSSSSNRNYDYGDDD